MEDALWERYGTVGAYIVWRNDDVYNVTDGEAPLSDSGYYNLEALLNLKGLRFDDVVLDTPENRSLCASPRF